MPWHPTHPRFQKMVLPDFHIAILFTNITEQNPHYSDGFGDTSLSSLGLLQAKKLPFKVKNISERFLSVSNSGELLTKHFLSLDNHSSAQKRPNRNGCPKNCCNKDSETIIKLFYHVCERNSNAKYRRHHYLQPGGR